MKYKYIIAIFLIGIIIQFIASLFKIMHYMNTGLLFIISTSIIVLALILGILKVVLSKNEFLNK
jgi:hypothetical protein